MIVVYAEKEDMGIKFAAALGGFNYNGTHINTENLSQYQDDIKKNLSSKNGYISTKYEGKEYKITWGWGHFGTLKDIKDYEPEYDKWYKIPLPYIPTKFESKRRLNNNPDPKAREHFRKRDDRQFDLVKRIFNDPSTEFIINATDWEREGELIFAYVYDLTGTTKPYLRLRNNAKTEKQIREDFSHLVNSTENYPFVLAARARSIADWVIGMNLTIAATLYLSKDRGLLNVGRVFTPTLALIVNRENEIRNFKPETTYGVTAEFTLADGNKYTGVLQQEENFKKKELAEGLIKDLSKNGVITSVEKKLEKKNPPLLYDTTALQVDANNYYGFTLDQTLKIAQSLYEHGFITYPRVDSTYLTEDKKLEVPLLLEAIIDSRFPQYKGRVKTNMPDRYFNDSKVSGHDAIIITDLTPSGLDEKQEKIYDLICRRMLMTVCPSMEVQKTVVTTNVGEEEFRTNGTILKQMGFMALNVKQRTVNNSELPSNIEEKANVTGEYSVFDQTSTPPIRYTEATLITAMKNCGRKMEDETAREYLKKSEGIGRPSTRASIMERLINMSFVERKKNTIYPTEKGMSAIASITIEDIKSPILTAKWEQDLDEIENSTPKECVSKLKAFLLSINQKATEWCNEMEKNKVTQISTNNVEMDVNCPVCGKKMLNFKDGYVCSGYKEGCAFRVPKKFIGKNISEAVLKELVTKGKTKEISGFKSKSGNSFPAMLKLVKAHECISCGAVQSNNPAGCYKCGGKLKESETQLTIGLEFSEKKRGRR